MGKGEFLSEYAKAEKQFNIVMGFIAQLFYFLFEAFPFFGLQNLRGVNIIPYCCQYFRSELFIMDFVLIRIHTLYRAYGCSLLIQQFPAECFIFYDPPKL